MPAASGKHDGKDLAIRDLATECRERERDAAVWRDIAIEAIAQIAELTRDNRRLRDQLQALREDYRDLRQVQTTLHVGERTAA